MTLLEIRKSISEVVLAEGLLELEGCLGFDATRALANRHDLIEILRDVYAAMKYSEQEQNQ